MSKKEKKKTTLGHWNKSITDLLGSWSNLPIRPEITELKKPHVKDYTATQSQIPRGDNETWIPQLYKPSMGNALSSQVTITKTR